SRRACERLWWAVTEKWTARCHLQHTPEKSRVTIDCIPEARRKQQCEGAQGGGNAFIPRHSCSSIFVVRLMLIPRSPCPPDQVGPPPAAPALQAATPLLRRRQA